MPLPGKEESEVVLSAAFDLPGSTMGGLAFAFVNLLSGRQGQHGELSCTCLLSVASSTTFLMLKTPVWGDIF